MTGVAGIIYLHRQEPERVRAGSHSGRHQVGALGAAKGCVLLLLPAWASCLPSSPVTLTSNFPTTDRSHQRSRTPLTMTKEDLPEPLLHQLLPWAPPSCSPSPLFPFSSKPILQKKPSPGRLPLFTFQSLLLKTHFEI